MTPKPTQKLLDIIRDLRPGKSFEHSAEAHGKYFWLWPVIFGFAAGLVSGLLALVIGIKFFMPQTTADNVGAPLVNGENLPAAKEPRTANQFLFERQGNAAVAIYKKAQEGSETVPVENFLQSGAPLTSDGWIATVKTSALSSGAGVVWNRKFYPIEKTLEDGFSGLVFLKIQVSGLPVLPFGNLDNARPGDDLFCLDGQGGLYSRRLINSRFYFTGSALRSSEALDVAGKIEESPAGAPLLNSRGELLGLAQPSGKMIPADFVESGLKAILKEGKLNRPVLGAHYLDLSASIFNKEPKQGALLKSSKDSKAVAKGSPAEKAGLKEGDIILSVDNFELNQNLTLAEAVAGFSSGTKVTLTILRDNKEVKVGVTL